MARYENTARNYMAEPVRRQQEETQRDFEVVEGRGLDARVRQGVSYEFLRKVKMVLAVAIVFVIIGVARVGLCSATVSSLQHCATLRSDIEEAQSLEDELRAERSVLSSSSRIEKIATENYGMTQATESTTIVLDESASDASATEQTDGSAAEQAASSDASDGDVGNGAAETGSATAEA